MPDTSTDARIGQEIVGYQIEERLGRGGMGLVYRARHLRLGRQAAIKIIAPELADSEGFRERFAREARIAASLHHPNVVTVYDAGEIDGELYIAMQYIEGSDLSKVLRTEGRLGPYRALDVCRQVAGALDAAHEVGLIHRDVKPANVLIEGRHAYLTDFGLTKRMTGPRTAPLTRAGDVVGTIHYAAPEQIEGGVVDARADVYALGCLLYHCLAGEVPFPKDSDVAVIYAHLKDQPPRVSETGLELPGGLDAVVARAMDKDPERRYASCADLVLAARAVVDAAGPLAEPLPRRAGPQPPPEDMDTLPGAPPPGAVPAPRGRVLLAGVDESTRAVVSIALGDRYEVDVTTERAHVLEAARGARPDLVLLGCQGAESDAAGFVSGLRSDPLTRDAKVMLVVDYDDASTREARSAGADESLAAPFSPMQLQVKLRKLLGAEAVGW